jgi:hypothetical protein
VSKQVHQIVNAPVVGNVSGGEVRVSNTAINNHQHTHHHQHDHTVHAHGPVHLHTHVEPPSFALQAPPAPPAHYRQRNSEVHPITPEQKDLLAMMRPLPKPVRNRLLDWMRTEFGTGLVMELDPDELRSLRRAVMGARRVAGLV